MAWPLRVICHSEGNWTISPMIYKYISKLDYESMHECSKRILMITLITYQKCLHAYTQLLANNLHTCRCTYFMGTFVTDTDKIISKMKSILSCICIINKNLTRWLPYRYGKLYKIFLFSLSDEVSTCTKARLADFQTTGSQYLSIYEFLQMDEDICVPWCNNSMVHKSNIEYNVQTLS